MGETQRQYEDTESLGTFSIEETSMLPNSAAVDNFLKSDDGEITSVDEPVETEVVDEAPQKPKKTTKTSKKKDTEEEEAPQGPTQADLEAELRSSLMNEADEQEEDQPEDTPSANEASVFGRLTKDLVSMGIFAETEDDNVSTGQEFVERFNAEKARHANELLDNFLSKFGEDYRNAFDAIFLKGVSPKEYFTTAENVSSFAEMSMDSVENQKRVFVEYFRSMGMAEEKIQTKLKRAIEDDTLVDDAPDFHELLVQKEQQKLQTIVQEKEKEQVRKQKELEDYSRSVETILSSKLKAEDFDGIPVNQKEASEVYDYMVNKKWRLKSGDVISDFERDMLELKYPENHEKALKMAMLLKNGIDLSKIQKKAISKKNDSLFVNLTTQKKQNPNNNKPLGSF